jgi:glycosyltransferase involved in cell wall biosynthesis
LRILFFSSQFFNVVNYLLTLQPSQHQFTWMPLIPQSKRTQFLAKLATVPDLETAPVQIYPLFLHAPSSNAKFLLQPQVVIQDFCTILRGLWTRRPDAVLVSYVLDAYPLAILKPLIKYVLFVLATGTDINLRTKPHHILLRKLIYHNSDGVFAVSRDLQRKIQQESAKRVEVLPTGVDTSFWIPSDPNNIPQRAQWRVNSTDFVVLTVSNLVVHKGVDIGLQAINRLYNNGWTNIKYLIVGDGPERTALEQRVNELGLRHVIHFLGEKNRHILLDLYNLADLFLLTSSTEGLPFSLLEAMACKTICLASPVGDIPRTLQYGRNGFTVSSISPAHFAAKIREIADLNPQISAEIRNNARSYVVTHHNLQTITELLVCRLIEAHDQPASRQTTLNHHARVLTRSQ